MDTNKETTDDKIRVIDVKLQIEKDPTEKQELQKRRQILQLQKEIEQIRKRIQQLS
jgi:hypothetical protein